MNIRSAIARVQQAPRRDSTAALTGRPIGLWIGTALLAAGIVLWLIGSGLVAMWCFTIAAVVFGLVLPFEYAIVSPLYMGAAGWLVDMLPFVVLAGWLAVVARWVLSLWRERRLPRGGRWIWLPIGLVAWSLMGLTAIDLSEIKHFTLLFGLQVLISGTILLAVDRFGDIELRARVTSGLLLFILVLSVVVLLQWMGVPMDDLQDETVAPRAEAAYGVDAFPNERGMIKYAKARNGGAYEVTQELAQVAKANPGLPEGEVFLGPLEAFSDGRIIVRFAGSAREYEDDLLQKEIELVYDNVGVAPANTVPRLRSFPRNALTYAGMAAALFPLGFFLAWGPDRRRRILGWLAIGACLFGAGFSIARGAWAVIAIGAVYLLIDGLISWRKKLGYVAAFLLFAVFMTVFFILNYQTDPLTARAGGESSVRTRRDLYVETVSSFSPRHVITGFGMTLSRSTDSTSYGKLGKYVPPAGTHSTYLNYFFRTGLPGALMIVALYAIAAAHARAAARSYSNGRRIFGTLAAAAVVTAAAHALILSLYVEPFYSLTIALVLGLAMAGTTDLPRSVWPWRRQPSAEPAVA